MSKPSALHFLLAFVAIMLCMAVSLLPEEISAIAAVFAPVLVILMLTSILCGWYYGLAIALIVPLAAFFLKREGTLMPEIPVVMLTLAVSAVVTGVTYKLFRKTLIACLIGLFAGRAAYAIGAIICSYIVRRDYTLGDFLGEAVTDILPGLVIALIGIPLLIRVFRRLGVMRILQNEPDLE